MKIILCFILAMVLIFNPLPAHAAKTPQAFHTIWPCIGVGAQVGAIAGFAVGCNAAVNMGIPGVFIVIGDTFTGLAYGLAAGSLVWGTIMLVNN